MKSKEVYQTVGEYRGMSNVFRQKKRIRMAEVRWEGCVSLERANGGPLYDKRVGTQ